MVGYTGGHTENPTYDQVCTHTTGHAEAVLIEFDPQKVSYKMLLKQFFRMHDPTQLNRQGPDIGDSYRSAIFYFDQEQRKEAIQLRNRTQEEIDKPIVTQIEPAGPFYEAEEYHQKFTEKTGIGMCHIPYAPVAQE
jgi:methionine-S-sulfoxide reductase